jgi:hypothetical protein
MRKVPRRPTGKLVPFVYWHPMPISSPRRFTLALTLVAFSAAGSQACFGWGAVGHTIINHLAAQTLPADVPAFMRSQGSIDEIAYLGPEPDRWRSPAEPELSATQAPDHFIDLENADVIGTLPRRRYDFIEELGKYRQAHPEQAETFTPQHVGMLPWQTEEVWERLKAGFRDYRELKAQGKDTKPVEAAIVFYAGWLGHYVGDGSQPLHVTRDYNGWVEKENPHGYTADHHIHSDFETVFVGANITAADVKPFLGPVTPIGDEWPAFLDYLHNTGSYIGQTYQLYKDGAFTGAGTPAGKEFAEQRIAAGATMLRNMIDAAWVKSAEPVPEYHDK